MNAPELSAYLSLMAMDHPERVAAIRADGTAALCRSFRDGATLCGSMAAAHAATELAVIVRLEQPAGFLQ